MDPLKKLLLQRRSCREFTEELLTPEETESILQAGLLAPSGRRINPWQFVVVENKGTLNLLSQSKSHGAGFLKTAAIAIVVLADVMSADTWIEDASIASVIMQLQAEQLGLGSCWCQIRMRESGEGLDAAQYVRDVLQIPYQLEVLSIIGFGHKKHATPPANIKDLQWEKVHIDKYQIPKEEKQA